jgi:hypothetical protein
VIVLPIFRQHIGFGKVLNGRIGFYGFFTDRSWFFFGRIGFHGFFTDSSGFSSDGLDFTVFSRTGLVFLRTDWIQRFFHGQIWFFFGRIEFYGFFTDRSWFFFGRNWFSA